jgi:protein phosphatase
MRWFRQQSLGNKPGDVIGGSDVPLDRGGRAAGANGQGGRSERQVTISERIGARTDRGLKRTGNQDRILAEELPDGAVLAAVADGVGGAAGGDVASSTAIEALHEEFTRGPYTEPDEVLARGFATSNQAVRERAAERAATKGMATTLVAALIDDDSAWIANLGDSRCYLFHEGALSQLTEASKSNYRNIITRGIGVAETAEPELTGPVSLPGGSLLLLCSDGLHGVVSDTDIAEVLGSGTPSRMAEQLIDLANRAGGPDNVSAVIVRS